MKTKGRLAMTLLRKQYSSRDKIELLRLHLVENISVPEICEQQNIHPTVFYRWQRQLFSRGHVVFQRRSLARLLSAYRLKVRNLKAIAYGRAREVARLRSHCSQNSGPHLTQITAMRDVACTSKVSRAVETPVCE